MDIEAFSFSQGHAYGGWKRVMPTGHKHGHVYKKAWS
jgi:hypothetical protein